MGANMSMEFTKDNMIKLQYADAFCYQLKTGSGLVNLGKAIACFFKGKEITEVEGKSYMCTYKSNYISPHFKSLFERTATECFWGEYDGELKNEPEKLSGDILAELNLQDSIFDADCKDAIDWLESPEFIKNMQKDATVTFVKHLIHLLVFNKKIDECMKVCAIIGALSSYPGSGFLTNNFSELCSTFAANCRIIGTAVNEPSERSKQKKGLSACATVCSKLIESIETGGMFKLMLKYDEDKSKENAPIKGKAKDTPSWGRGQWLIKGKAKDTPSWGQWLEKTENKEWASDLKQQTTVVCACGKYFTERLKNNKNLGYMQRKIEVKPLHPSLSSKDEEEIVKFQASHFNVSYQYLDLPVILKISVATENIKARDVDPDVDADNESIKEYLDCKILVNEMGPFSKDDEILALGENNSVLPQKK